MNPFLIGFAIAAIAAAVLFAWQERQHRRTSTVVGEVQANALRTVTDLQTATLSLIAESQRRQEAYVLEVLNRFLSRSHEERVMGDMINREVQVDQDSGLDAEEELTRKAVADHLASLDADMRAAAGKVATAS